jgi:hypothetical protein
MFVPLFANGHKNEARGNSETPGDAGRLQRDCKGSISSGIGRGRHEDQADLLGDTPVERGVGIPEAARGALAHFLTAPSDNNTLDARHREDEGFGL